MELFPTHIVGAGVDAQQGRQYDVAPDGRFLINIGLESAAAPITLLMNWNLKQRSSAAAAMGPRTCQVTINARRRLRSVINC